VGGGLRIKAKQAAQQRYTGRGELWGDALRRTGVPAGSSVSYKCFAFFFFLLPIKVPYHTHHVENPSSRGPSSSMQFAVAKRDTATPREASLLPGNGGVQRNMAPPLSSRENPTGWFSCRLRNFSRRCWLAAVKMRTSTDVLISQHIKGHTRNIQEKCAQ